MQYILGAYSQLPFGSSSEEYEVLLSSQLKPLLTTVYQNPGYKLLFHLSASEYEYYEANHPEINMLICDLCRKGQMEILSSGYYDVVLSLLPAHERSTHVEKTTTYIRKRFTKKPKGLWCYNQIFTPSLIPMMSVSGLDYILISSYNQMVNGQLMNKPFYMDEMGKTSLVIPFDDRFSRETYDFSRGISSLDKYLADMEKLALGVSGLINTIMINLDQLAPLEGSNAVFPLLYSKLGANSTLPSIFLSQNEVKRSFYLPAGVYGRDISMGKALSLNQYILENPVLSRNLGILNLLREAMRECKKNTDERKNMEKLFLKASACGLYIPEQGMSPAIRRVSNRCLCEIESILAKTQGSMIPQMAYLDFAKHGEYIVAGKTNVCYLNTKGAVISRLNMSTVSYDMAMHTGEGLFADSFIDCSTGKETSLSSKIYEVTPLDKRRVDFFAKAPALELGKIPVNITKRFKFRQSTVMVEIEIENLDNSRLDGFEYCCTLDLALPKAYDVKDGDGAVISESPVETNMLSIADRTAPFSISIALSEASFVSSENYEQKVRTCLGDKSVYEYTQLKIRRRLSLEPLQDTRLTIGLRMEKRKEKNNDTSEQSST